MNHIQRGTVIAFATWLFAVGNAFATDKPAIIPPPPKPVVVTETKHDYSAALVGAGIAWWLTRRHAKRSRPDPVVAVPPPPEPLTCEPVVERVLEACGVSK